VSAGLRWVFCSWLRDYLLYIQTHLQDRDDDRQGVVFHKVCSAPYFGLCVFIMLCERVCIRSVEGRVGSVAPWVPGSPVDRNSSSHDNSRTTTTTTATIERRQDEGNSNHTTTHRSSRLRRPRVLSLMVKWRQAGSARRLGLQG
jgi:hypothetical protein